MGARLLYEYDFGDGWQHELLLEEVLLGDETFQQTCVAGKRCCPPEDCGGPQGFAELLQALQDANHPSHDEACEWLGDFAPESFSADEVNRRLSPQETLTHTKARSMSAMAFHEKAGRSQVGSVVFSLDKGFLSAERHSCRHPSIRTLCERCAPGASWVFSFQPVLPPDWRPVFLFAEKLGQAINAVTGTRRFGLCFFPS